MQRKKWSEGNFYLKFGNMSRLANKPIEITKGVEIKIDGNSISVKGPRGELKRDFKINLIEIKIEGDTLILKPKANDIFSNSLWGTYASHLRNMMHGVTEGYEKKLIVEGVGFKSEVKGKNLEMALGFSHPVILEIPEGLTVTAEKNVITITGVDKELVGQFTAKIRAKKKPEPYKGKGIRYEDEVIRRKQGKKVV